MRGRQSRGTIAVFVASMLLLAPLRGGSEVRVPWALQAAIFNKIFNYDRQFEQLDRRQIRLVVLSGSTSTTEQRKLLEAFHKLGLSAEIADSADLDRALAKASVVYVYPDSDLKAIKRICRERKILSATGDAKLVNAGHAAVGVVLGSNGRAEIRINLQRLKSDGHQLSSDLLELAKLVGRN